MGGWSGVLGAVLRAVQETLAFTLGTENRQHPLNTAHRTVATVAAPPSSGSCSMSRRHHCRGHVRNPGAPVGCSTDALPAEA